MGQFFEEIPDNLIAWIQKQRVFWVASAPLDADGHVNVSPKGVEGTFHIKDSNTVWYEDLTGSGIETISHMQENGRVTILFNALEGAPRIVRLFGKGTVHEFGTEEYDQLIPPSTRKPGSRAVILIHVTKVGSSCGWGVPVYEFQSHRTKLLSYSAKLEELDNTRQKEGPSPEARQGLKDHWMTSNIKSLDGLPGLLVNGETASSRAFVNTGVPSYRNSSKKSGSLGWFDGRTATAFAGGALTALVVSRVLSRFN